MSDLSIQEPYVVATLPRPLNQSKGRYVVADVHGGVPGSRKRKRAELAVGIDGEAVNIYDTRISKLVTSYALPPKSSFTCAPYSYRLRQSGRRELERRTYVSTRDTASDITLFVDRTLTNGMNETKSTSYSLSGVGNHVVSLSLVNGAAGDELVLVRRDGEIQGLDAESLQCKWISPSSSIGSESSVLNAVHNTVEFCLFTHMKAAEKSIFKERPDIVGQFSEGIDTSLLVILTKPVDAALSPSRTLHVLLLPKSQVSSGQHRLIKTLLSIDLPWIQAKEPAVLGTIIYDMNVSSGAFYELADGQLFISDLTSTLPKVQSQLSLPDHTSFLRLSKHALITSNSRNVKIYDPTFGSLQASVSSTISPGSLKRKRNFGDGTEASTAACQLVSFSPKQNLVHALQGNTIVALQIETSQDLSSSHMGLLIDSLGRGEQTNIHTKAYNTEILDKYAAENDVEAFESNMAWIFHMNRDETELQKWKATKVSTSKVNGAQTNGDHSSADSDTDIDSKPISPWVWHENRSSYATVDPFWCKYALSKIFGWTQANESGDASLGGESSLIINILPYNVLRWLTETGNLTKHNLESALRKQLVSSHTRSIPSGDMVDIIASIDPGMDLLMILLSNTFLDAAELVHALQLLMDSLGLFGDHTQAPQGLLTNGDIEMGEVDVEARIAAEEEAIDADLQLAEFQLNEGSGIRGQALSVALAKLHACPASSIVHALKNKLSSDEIVSLIYLLRFELARGSWTSRYLERREDDEENDQNENIVLVIDLLNNCIDAIGSGGWLSGDAMLAKGDQFESEELVTSLKLEVSAALEGLQEANFIKGLTKEMVRYGEAVQTTMPAPQVEYSLNGVRNKPITLPSATNLSILPFGLKIEEQVSRLKVGAGGEVYKRTLRDIGHLKSKKVGKYSRERIAI